LKTAAAPAIVTHDLLTSTHLHSFKTSTSGLASTSYVPTQDYAGGAVFSVQEGKALLHVWAWQKVCRAALRAPELLPPWLELMMQDQMHIKIHLPEKMSCFAVSPNGCWAAAGSGAGQVYLWEVSWLATNLTSGDTAKPSR
jgi:pre-rRNA-processing protein IPI3